MEPKITHLMLRCINYKRLCLFCLFSLFFVLTAGATEYIVSPAPNDEFGVSVAGEKVTVVEEFTIYWQFLLWLAMMQILSAIDTLLYRMRFIYVIAGFRTAQHVNILDNSSRYNIHTYIKNNPGVYFSEIVESTGLNRGTVKYHLQILKTKNKIEAYEDSGKIRYFLNNSDYSEEEKRVLVTLQNVTNQRIVSEILDEKCNTNVALAREFGVSRATISWYVKNLKGTGIIKETKKGRNIVYKINTSYKTLIKRYR